MKKAILVSPDRYYRYMLEIHGIDLSDEKAFDTLQRMQRVPSPDTKAGTEVRVNVGVRGDDIFVIEDGDMHVWVVQEEQTKRAYRILRSFKGEQAKQISNTAIDLFL